MSNVQCMSYECPCPMYRVIILPTFLSTCGSHHITCHYSGLRLSLEFQSVSHSLVHYIDIMWTYSCTLVSILKNRINGEK